MEQQELVVSGRSTFEANFGDDVNLMVLVMALVVLFGVGFLCRLRDAKSVDADVVFKNYGSAEAERV